MEVFRKMGASLLMVVYLLSATTTNELLKLPLLVDHYYDHKQENKRIGLISFIVQHYIIEDGTDQDAEEDGKLPFKSAEDFAIVTFVSLMPPSSIEAARPAIEINSNFGNGNELIFASQYLAAIWQPPRHC